MQHTPTGNDDRRIAKYPGHGGLASHRELAELSRKIGVRIQPLQSRFNGQFAIVSNAKDQEAAVSICECGTCRFEPILPGVVLGIRQCQFEVEGLGLKHAGPQECFDGIVTVQAVQAETRSVPYAA